MKSFRLLAMGLFLFAVIGCDRREPVPVATPPAAAKSKPALQLAPAPTAAVVVPVETALHHLNNAVRNYYAEKLQLPATIEDVYRAGYLKERFTPPPNQQFVINPQTRAVEVR